jgi:hypothetical protein
MTEKPKPNWQPLSNLPMIASLIDGQWEDTQEQLKTLSEVRHKPHVLDDMTVARICKVYTEQAEFIWVFEAQLTKWQQEEYLTSSQEAEIKRLEDRVRQWKQDLKSILDLAEELKHGTIEKVLAKDDLALGIQALLAMESH